MFSKFFNVPALTSTFDSDFLLATDRIVSYDYTKRFSKSGDFSIVLPFDREILQAVKINGMIYFDKDWLWIQSVSYDGQRIVIAGKDCKGFLETRIILPTDEGYAGYDAVIGTTAECIRHYLDNNCISPSDNARKLPLKWGGGAVGLTNDSYMARFEYLSDVVNALCDNAEIGYDVSGTMAASGFKLYTVKGTDRSFEQSERPRVIFSAKWGNVLSQSFEHGVDNLLNAVYGTDSNGYSRLIPTTASGIAGRECNISVSVSTTNPWFDKYALNEIRDNVETHSFEIAVPVGGYGTEYFLGDKVTVKDDFTGDRYTRVITEVTKSYSQGRQSLTLTLGSSKQKPVQKIVNNLLNGTQQRR